MNAQTNDLRVSSVAGMVLAGGASRRFFGEDKTWQPLNGKPLIQHVLNAASQQVTELCVNSNQNNQSFLSLGLPLISDNQFGSPSPQQGPLSGIYVGLKWAKMKQYDWLMVFPVDTPTIPKNLVERLYHEATTNDKLMVSASDLTDQQTVLSLCSTKLIPPLEQLLKIKTKRVRDSLSPHLMGHVLFSDFKFININCAADLSLAAQQLTLD